MLYDNKEGKMKTHFFSAVRNQSGFTLMAVYLVTALLAIFAIAHFSRSVVFVKTNERNVNRMIAFNMAESGVDWAISQLASDTEYTGTSAYVPLDTNFMKGGFTVSVTKDDSDPKIRIIQANGFAPSNDSTSRAYQNIKVTAYAKYGDSNLFDFAIFSKNSINLTASGTVASVDSYDSRNGPYSSGNSGGEGDIASNSIAASTITLGGNTLVNGDVLIGPDGDISTGISVGPNATYTGSPDTLSSEQQYPDPTVPAGIPSSGNLSVSGNTNLILTPGTYHYTSLNISGNGRLTLTGPTEIYVSGEINITGNGIATQGNLPTNLIIYVTTSDTVKVGGNGAFYGGIYAPNSTVKNVGNGGIFGSVVSENYIQTGNSSIHYDLAMRDIENKKRYGDLKVLAWQEKNTLLWGTGTAVAAEI